MTLCVKGVKGNFTPVMTWYQNVFKYSRYLTSLIRKEKKKQEALTFRINVIKVMSIVASGCFSQSFIVS